MKPKNLAYIGLIALFFFFFLAIVSVNAAPEAENTTVVANKTIIIVAQNTKFNNTSPLAIKVEKNTNYTIVFKNIDEGVQHNLIIVLSRDWTEIKDGSDPQAGDILLGPVPDNATTNDTGSASNPPVYITSWVTPNEDTYVPFYCSFFGHFNAGMYGYFEVGEPGGRKPFSKAAAPGFELIVGLTAIISLTGLTVLKKRRTK